MYAKSCADKATETIKKAEALGFKTKPEAFYFVLRNCLFVRLEQKVSVFLLAKAEYHLGLVKETKDGMPGDYVSDEAKNFSKEWLQ